MTDHPETLSRYRLPLSRDHLKQVGAALPFLRYVPKNPLLLIGAAAVGIAGVMAWRYRGKIAARTAPLIEDARLKGHALVDEAKARGEDLIDQARTATEAVAAKAKRVRRGAAAEKPVIDLH